MWLVGGMYGCGWSVECMGVDSVCVVSRRWVWLVGVGGIYG